MESRPPGRSVNSSQLQINFASQRNSFVVVQEDINTGAPAYMPKSFVESELLPAADGVLRGDRFVSSTVKGYELTDPLNANAPHGHEVLFYSDDATRSHSRYLKCAAFHLPTMSQ